MLPHLQMHTHTHRRQDHFWILLRCVKILFYLSMLQCSFYILAQSLNCALQFFEYNVNVALLQPPQLPLSPSSTGLSIFPIVLLFEMLYNLLGQGTIPEKMHIQRTAIRYCTVCFQVGCFQATLNEIALSWIQNRICQSTVVLHNRHDPRLSFSVVYHITYIIEIPQTIKQNSSTFYLRHLAVIRSIFSMSYLPKLP